MHIGLPNLMVEYFNKLFASEAGPSMECLRAIRPTITATENEVSLAPFTETEIHDAVFAMHPDKSPSQDRMNPAFYQRYWDIVGKDVSTGCLSFISACEFP